MSLYQKASLVQIPSGYKAADAKLYSVVPNSGDGDFTVSSDADATRVNKDGLIETVAINQARLDYPLLDGVVQDNPVLLLEPERTNLVQYSEDFTQSYWSKIGSSISPNISISPDGTQNASKLIEDNLNGLKRLRINAILTSGDNTLSFFVKSAERNWILLREAGQTGAYAFFDLENGVIGQSNLAENIEIKQFNNDWYRISFKDNVTSVAIELRLALSDGVDSYQGDGTSGVYIWGAQVEAGSYLTSYIPTAGSAVTRTQDNVYNGGTSSTFNLTEGSFLLDFEQFNVADNFQRTASLSDGTDPNKVVLIPQSNGTQIRFFVKANNTVVRDTYENLTYNTRNKLAFSYGGNRFKIYINGVLVDSVTTFTPFSSLDRINFSDEDNNPKATGKFYQVMYFNEELTEAELITLTT